MKVLKNNYKKYNSKTYPIKVICDECKSELEIEETDISEGLFGCSVVTCPCCHNEILLDNIDVDLEVTQENVKFPDHFIHFIRTGEEEYLSANDEINQRIKTSIKYLEEHPNSALYYTEFKDSFVVVFNHFDEDYYYVVVTKDFYTTEIKKYLEKRISI